MKGPPAEIGIPFMTDLVLSIERDEKTVTRRTSSRWARVPPGMVLWVRETWRTHERPEDGLDGIEFRAGGVFVPIANTPEAADRWGEAHKNGKHGTRWRPPMFMSRWMARHLLRVVSVTVEPGIEIGPFKVVNPVPRVTDAEARLEGLRDRTDFVAVWRRLHPDHGGPVYRIEFERMGGA